MPHKHVYTKSILRRRKKMNLPNILVASLFPRRLQEAVAPVNLGPVKL